jgi:hypothetical protein
MIATAINAAIRPYSIAVAPDSSFTKCFKRDFMDLVPSPVSDPLLNGAAPHRGEAH